MLARNGSCRRSGSFGTGDGDHQCFSTTALWIIGGGGEMNSISTAYCY